MIRCSRQAPPSGNWKATWSGAAAARLASRSETFRRSGRSGAAAAGWTLYPPLTIQAGMGMDLTIFAVHILGMSSILAAVAYMISGGGQLVLGGNQLLDAGGAQQLDQ